MAFERSSHRLQIEKRLQFARTDLGQGTISNIDWLIDFILEEGKGKECLAFLGEKILKELDRKSSEE